METGNSLKVRVRGFIVKLSFIASPFLFAWWSAIAYEQRGYLAVGGEYSAFVIPFIIAGIAYGFCDEE